MRILDDNEKLTERVTFAAYARWYTALAVGLAVLMTQPVVVGVVGSNGQAAVTAWSSSWGGLISVAAGVMLLALFLASLIPSTIWLPVVVAVAAMVLAVVLQNASDPRTVPPAAGGAIALCIVSGLLAIVNTLHAWEFKRDLAEAQRANEAR
ncbi:MAG: hypothetical protein ACRD0P_02915 [Stackebrandtia sp.]